MAELNPLEPGDVPFPQYSVTTTEAIEPGVTILKGVIYTKNAAGNLVISTGDLSRGIFQARETPFVNVPAIAGDFVQVLGPRTRMILRVVSAGLVAGDIVDSLANTVDVLLATDTIGPEFVGRIFEIYTKDVDGNKKKVTASTELVIVETVGP